MNRKKVLWVDNDPQESLSVKEYLESEGYEVDLVTTPQEAISYMAARPVDVAVIDLRLVNDRDENDFSGITLAKQSNPSVPKIIWTSYPTWEAVRRALGPDFDGLPAAVGFVSKRSEEGLPALLTAIKTALSPADTRFARKVMQSFDVKAPVALHHRIREVGPEEAGTRVRRSLEDVTAELVSRRELATREAARWNRSSLVAGWVLLALLLVTGVLLLLSSVTGGILSLVATVVTKFIQNVFAAQEKTAHERIRESYNELERINRAANMLTISESLPPKDRVIYLKKILDHMISEKWLLGPEGGKPRPARRGDDDDPENPLRG